MRIAIVVALWISLMIVSYAIMVIKTVPFPLCGLMGIIIHIWRVIYSLCFSSVRSLAWSVAIAREWDTQIRGCWNVVDIEVKCIFQINYAVCVCVCVLCLQSINIHSIIYCLSAEGFVKWRYSSLLSARASDNLYPKIEIYPIKGIDKFCWMATQAQHVVVYYNNCRDMRSAM